MIFVTYECWTWFWRFWRQNTEMQGFKIEVESECKINHLEWIQCHQMIQISTCKVRFISIVVGLPLFEVIIVIGVNSQERPQCLLHLLWQNKFSIEYFTFNFLFFVCTIQTLHRCSETSLIVYSIFYRWSHLLSAKSLLLKP